MSNPIFDYLCRISDLVSERGAAVPQLQEIEKDWHGAAFDLLGTRCVISADETRMIVDLGDTIPLPGVKPWVKGIANIGGRVVAITDLTAFVSGGKQNSGGRQALIINGRGVHTGLMIEQSYGGVRLSTEQLNQETSVSESLKPFVSGVFSTDDGDYALLDTTRLLTDADFTEASVITPN